MPQYVDKQVTVQATYSSINDHLVSHYFNSYELVKHDCYLPIIIQPNEWEMMILQQGPVLYAISTNLSWALQKS